MVDLDFEKWNYSRETPMNTAYNTHKDNVFLSVFSSAFERFSSLIEDLSQSPEFFAFDSDQLETHLFTEGLELMRLLLQAHYDLRAPARPNSDIWAYPTLVDSGLKLI